MRIEDLSPQMQAQARAKLQEQNKRCWKSIPTVDSPEGSKPRRRKYNNIDAEVANIKFDSRKEANRYKYLMDLQKASEISDLRLQAHFTLQEAFKRSDGEKVNSIVYIADFTYLDADGNLVIEDVKSEATRKDKVYSLKRRLMAGKGYRITEV